MLIKQDVGFYLHQEGPNLGKTSCPLPPVTIRLDAQFRTPYPRSASFDTDTPRATVHPPSTSSSLHLRLFIHGLLFIQPPPCATPPATVQPPLSMDSYSTTPPWGYCSSTPPPSTVHPALHGVLFIQPQPPRSIGVLFIQRQHHGVLFIHPHRELFIHPPATLTVYSEAASIGFS